MNGSYNYELVNSPHTFKVQLLSVFGSISLLVLVLYLIRKGYLREGYSLGWLFISLLVFVVSVFGDLLADIAQLTGIYYAPTAIMLVLIFGLILVSIHLSVLSSKHDKQIKDLIQENALLKEKRKGEKELP